MIGIDTTFLIDLEILDSPRHKGAFDFFQKWLSEKNTQLCIFNQTFLEFQHVITDSKRFNSPLTMKQAIERTLFWIDQERIKIIYSSENSLKRAQLWLSVYNLGRNRIQDTHLAAAYAEAGVSTLVTANPNDFKIFEIFELKNY